MSKELNEEGKEQVALALLLLKEFKCNGRFDVDMIKVIIELAQHLGVFEQYEKLSSQIPPLKITQRYGESNG